MAEAVKMTYLSFFRVGAILVYHIVGVIRGKLPNQPFKQERYKVESGGLPKVDEVCCTYSASNSFLMNRFAIGCKIWVGVGGESEGMGHSLEDP